jgi:hypothetical protein
MQTVDTGIVSPQQSLVLSEARCLLVWLGVQLGVLHTAAAEAIMGASFCNEVVDLQHSQSRCAIICAGCALW